MGNCCQGANEVKGQNLSRNRKEIKGGGLIESETAGTIDDLILNCNQQVNELRSHLGAFSIPTNTQDPEELERRNIVSYTDGGKYLGEWSVKTGMRHGEGIHVWEDGAIYEG